MIIAAKFNCSVPGTLTAKCAQLVTVTKDLATPSLASTTLIIHDQTTFITNSSTMLPPTEFIDRLSITGIILVIVGSVTILIGTVMVCAMVLFRNCHKNSNVAAQPQNQGITVLSLIISNHVYTISRIHYYLSAQIPSQEHNIIDLLCSCT